MRVSGVLKSTGLEGTQRLEGPLLKSLDKGIRRSERGAKTRE